MSQVPLPVELCDTLADFGDRLGRRDGIYQVYDMVSSLGHITGTTLQDIADEE